jgi:hypothetical protein
MAFFSRRDVGQPGRSRFGKLSPSQTLGTVRLAPRL